MAGHKRVLKLVEEAEGAAPQEQVGGLEGERGGDVEAGTARHEVVGNQAACG